MDDEQYAKRALALAVTSFVLANSIFIFSFISPFFDLSTESQQNLFYALTILGLLASLPIAFIAYKMGKRMKGSFAAINLTRILSVLELLESPFWLIFALIIVPLIHRYGGRS
jgi:hypothetical protein